MRFPRCVSGARILRMAILGVVLRMSSRVVGSQRGGFNIRLIFDLGKSLVSHYLLQYMSGLRGSRRVSAWDISRMRAGPKRILCLIRPYAECTCVGVTWQWNGRCLAEGRYAMSAMSIRARSDYGKKLYFGSQSIFPYAGYLVMEMRPSFGRQGGKCGGKPGNRRASGKLLWKISDRGGQIWKP